MRNQIFAICILASILMMPLQAVADSEFDYAKLTETLLNQDPDPVEPGEYVELRFKVVKEGNEELRNIRYELETEHPFYFDASDKAVKSLGDWIGNSENQEYYLLYYKMRTAPDAVEGSYNVTLLERHDGTDVVGEEEFEIRVGEEKRPVIDVGNVRSSPEKLVADYDEAKLSVDISNLGDEDAEQVRAELNLPEGFTESFGYANRVTLATIAAGESKTAEFYMDTQKSLSQGSYNTTLDIRYREDDEDVPTEERIVTKELPVTIKVFGRPKYELQNYSVTEGLSASFNGAELLLDVQNIGSREADTVSVRILKDSSQPFSFDDKSDYIGKLEVGGSGQAGFTFDVDESAQVKDYRLTVQVRSVVDEEVFIEDHVVEIPVNTQTQSGAFPWQYLIGLVVLVIVGFIGYRLGKKRQHTSGKGK